MVGIHEDTLYHIYAKDRCIYNCLDEEEFEETWEMLKVMVGILKTDYTESDLSYVKDKRKGRIRRARQGDIYRTNGR